MELIFGTRNQAKIDQVKSALIGLNIKIVGLPDENLPEILEDGKTPQENARKKALGYSMAINQPVLSMDNGLYIDGLPRKQQPGTNVRRINNRTDRPSDEELLDHYSKIIKGLGGKTDGRWEFALCLANPQGEIQETTIISPRIFVSEPSEKIVVGYPLDSMQIDPDSQKHISEMTQDERARFWQKTIGNPFKAFVRRSLDI